MTTQTKTETSEAAKVKPKIEREPTHCVDCGAEFGKECVIGVLMGIPITGKVIFADYEGSMLCEDCMDKLVERESGLTGADE